MRLPMRRLKKNHRGLLLKGFACFLLVILALSPSFLFLQLERHPGYRLRSTGLGNSFGNSFISTWNLEMIGVDLLDVSDQGNKSVIIALIDSGIDYRLPELNKSLWRNPGEVSGDG